MDTHPPPDKLTHPREGLYWQCECGQEEVKRDHENPRAAMDGALHFRPDPCPRCKRSMMLASDPEEP